MTKFILAGVYSCVFALSAFADTTTAGIGTAPANSKQDKILDSALSSQTRQTLQEAMDSVASTSHTSSRAK